MKYEILIKKSAEKEIGKLEKNNVEKIKKRIFDLEENPRPKGHKKLQGSDYYRIRVGNFRVIYSINDKKNNLRILSVKDRKDVYK